MADAICNGGDGAGWDHRRGGAVAQALADPGGDCGADRDRDMGDAAVTEEARNRLYAGFALLMLVMIWGFFFASVIEELLR
jgi:hypothetical protein